MDENKQSTEETTSADKMADVELQSPFLKKFENFMYYHKWHTVAALVLVFAIIVCTVQMCSRESGDISFFVVGGIKEDETNNFTNYQLNNNEQRALTSSVINVLMANDENCRVSYLMRYIEDPEVLKDTDDAAYYGNSSYENAQIFRTELATAEAYICLFSPAVYNLTREYFPYKKTESGEYVYGVGDSLSSSVTTWQGDKIAYTFTVDALTDSSATLTFQKNK